MTRFLIQCGTALLFLTLSGFIVPSEGSDFKRVSEGLKLGEFRPNGKSSAGESPVVILRVDPSKNSFRLLSALGSGGRPRSTREWCEEFGLLAAINAGLYKSNFQSTGYMRDHREINNPSFHPALGAFFLFNPRGPRVPAVAWADSRRDKEWLKHLKGYDTVIQGYRMIADGRRVRWPEKERAHSTAALGMDREGQVLFILSRTPRTTHDLIEVLLSFPLRIKEAMYLEGGDEASLSLHLKGQWTEWLGLPDTPFPAQGPPRIPNVIGVVKRK